MPPATGGVDPAIREIAALIGDPNDQRLHTCRRGFGDAHIQQAEIGLTPFQTDLADAPIRAPVSNTVRGFCRQLVGHIADEHEIRILDFH